MNIEKLFVKTTVNFTFCLIIKGEREEKTYYTGIRK